MEKGACLVKTEHLDGIDEQLIAGDDSGQGLGNLRVEKGGAESESSHSSSSSSGEDDDGVDEGEVSKEVQEDLEEGKIMETDEEDGDDDDDVNDADIFNEFLMDDEDDEGGGVQEPIMSKNELRVLPPVPPVDVTLQPSHQMLPVGFVSSILGVQVIVEGADKHSPLSEGSILWMTGKRSPLGRVDEIFGPVKNPYYIVRYNLESEVPEGIHEGTLVSFVPEFVDHVLNNKDLYQNGYDASGDNDEEVDEAEFSDDEKEAEYRRMMKMSKRGSNTNMKPGGNKKSNKRFKRNDEEVDASGNNDEEVDEAEFSDDEKEAEYRRMMKMSKRGSNTNMKPGGNKKSNKRFKRNDEEVDASGNNDEEVDEAEFSDYEKEAEYRRMMKMSKRGSNTNMKPGGNKKSKKSVKRNDIKSRNCDHSNSRQDSPPVQTGNSQNQRVESPVRHPTDRSNQPGSSRFSPACNYGPGMISGHPQPGQPSGFPSNGPQPNGMPFQMQNGESANGFQMPWIQQHQQFQQLPMMNSYSGPPFQQAFNPADPNQNNMVPPYSPLPAGGMVPNTMNQDPFSMALVQLVQLSMLSEVLSSGLLAGQGGPGGNNMQQFPPNLQQNPGGNNMQHPPPNSQQNAEALPPPQFNQGAGSGPPRPGGRRGGGRSGGRG